MAHKSAAFKHISQTRKRTARNRQVKERLKDSTKMLAKLLAANKEAEARALLPKFSKLLDKAGRENIIHRNRANRLKSAWMQRVSKVK